MLTADDKKFNPPDDAVYRISPVTVYFDLEPKQLKIKYEMDRFFFKRRENLKKEIAGGNLAMLVEQYRKAVFAATGVKVGVSPAKAAEETAKRFNVTA